MEQIQHVKPCFMTYKYTLESISDDRCSNYHHTKLQVFDTQLYDHLCQTVPVYMITCGHTHNHRTQTICKLSNEPSCKKCSIAFTLFLDSSALLYHSDCKKNNLYYTSDYHQHTSNDPCNTCINCIIGAACVLNGKSTLCNLTTDVLNHTHSQTFNRLVYHDQVSLREHIRPIKFCSLFYVCFTHKHRHRNDEKLCSIQTYKCCDDALHITEFIGSFIVVYTKHKPKEFLIYDPTIWKSQSINKFICFLRALFTTTPTIIDQRYKAFSNSSFKTPQLSIYKSGKFSLARTNVTGFETFGLYQTSIMSELIPDDVVLIPGVLYDMAVQKFDMDLVAVKRDPVFYNTSLAVFKAVRNPDETVRAFVFPYGWGIPFHQDIDGDKNTVYFLAKVKHGFDFTQSFAYKISKYELNCTLKRTLSLLATSRYSLSENVRYEIFSNPSYFVGNSFWQKTHTYGPQFMADAGASYLKDEFTSFKSQSRELFASSDLRLLSINDLLNLEKLQSFVDSKSKGNAESIRAFIKSMSTSQLFSDPERISSCVNQYNNYSQGNQHLRFHGKEQFIAFYSMQDMILLTNLVFLNKKLLADLSCYPGLYSYVFTEASLICFKNDLLNDS